MEYYILKLNKENEKASEIYPVKVAKDTGIQIETVKGEVFVLSGRSLFVKETDYDVMIFKTKKEAEAELEHTRLAYWMLRMNFNPFYLKTETLKKMKAVIENKDGTEFAGMMVLSTAHVTEHTAGLLNNNHIPELTICNNGNHGWIIHVPETEAFTECEEFAELCGWMELYNILQYASKKGMDWINLDQDGQISNYFPKYDW